MIEIRPRNGGEVTVESVQPDGVRLTCTDHEDDEIAVIYLSDRDAKRLSEALRDPVTRPGGPA